MKTQADIFAASQPTTRSQPSEAILIYDDMKARFTSETLTHIAGIRFYIERRATICIAAAALIALVLWLAR